MIKLGLYTMILIYANTMSGKILLCETCPIKVGFMLRKPDCMLYNDFPIACNIICFILIYIVMTVLRTYSLKKNS